MYQRFTVWFACVGMIFGAYASAPSPFLKISYIQTPASPSRLKIIKMQIKDSARFAHYSKIVTESRIYFSLYVNLNTREMVCVRDSHKVNSIVSVPSVVEIAYKPPSDTVELLEFFAKKKYYYSIPLQSKLWSIDVDDIRHILNFTAMRAYLANDMDKYSEVWVTTDLQPLGKRKSTRSLYSCTPNYYIGAPGIVLEANNVLGHFKAVKIDYLESEERMQEIIALKKKELTGATSISLRDVMSDRRNFISKYMRILDALK